MVFPASRSLFAVFSPMKLTPCARSFSMSVCDCGSSRQAAMLSAVVCPMSRISVISSTGAVSSASSEPKWSLRMRPAFCPTCRMPNANSSRDRSRVLLASIEWTRLFAQVSTFLPSGSSCSTVRSYRSAADLTSPASISFCRLPSPQPSMSIASRDAKCIRFRKSCAGHEALVQRIAASSSSSYTGAPHTGQNFGNSYGTESSGRRSFSTPIISGMISPAFRTETMSPTRASS